MLTTHLKPFRLMVFIMTLLSLICLYDYYIVGNTTLSDEGAFIENVTALSFLFACITLLFQSLNKKGLERLNTLFFATTSLLFFIREIDLDQTSTPSLIYFFSDGIGRSILFVILYLSFIILAITRHQVLRISTIRGYLKSHVTRLVIIACFGIIAGALLEELHLQFLEELSEMNASLLLLLAAIIHHKEVIYEG